VLALEADRPARHHHHTAVCTRCGAAWYADMVRTPLGVPVPSRRDTYPCGCGARLILAVMISEVPEVDCRCGAGCLSGLEAAA
jgi:hypothetical protein